MVTGQEIMRILLGKETVSKSAKERHRRNVAAEKGSVELVQGHAHSRASPSLAKNGTTAGII